MAGCSTDGFDRMSDKQPCNWQNFVEHAELTDVGLRRSNNQDALSCVLASSEADWRRRGHLFIVADGMGAHAAGELASKIAVDTIPHTYFKLLDDSPPVAMQKAIEDANGKIHSRGQANPDFKGMGTTSSVLLLLPQGAVVAHVGDSRVYRLRGNRLEQLSFDHSLVWEMMAAAKMGKTEVPSFVPKNIITRSLGPSDTVRVDLEGPFPLAAGDIFLLCSDGLSGLVNDEELGVILNTLPPKEAAQVLVDLANLRGGPDNITTIVLRINDVAGIQQAPSAGSPLQGQSRGKPIHPLSWIVFGVLVLAAPGLALVKQLAAAMFAGLAALVAGVVVLVQWFGGKAGPTFRIEGGLLGHGPHATQVCQANNEFVDKLSKVMHELRDAAVEQNWVVDWNKFNSFDRRATAAAEGKDYSAAVREYCQAIDFMMQQLRRQRKTGSSPSLESGGP